MTATPLPVLMVLADQQDFYYTEYSDTLLSLEASGLSVVVAATTTNPTMPHLNSGQPLGSTGEVTPDIALADVNSADYSAIAFIGGWGASMYQYAFHVDGHYYANDLYNGDPATQLIVNNLINEFIAADKHVAAICHGVSVLVWARVDGVSPLEGRQISVPFIGTPEMVYEGSHTPNLHANGLYQQAIDNGAFPNLVSGQYGDPTTAADDVVVDGRFITAENYDSAWYFGQVLAQEILAAFTPTPTPPVSLDGPNLLVYGTPNDDTIHVWSGLIPEQVSVWINGDRYGPFLLPSGGRVIVYGGDGNDHVIATNLNVSATLYGQGGNDTLIGGSADDVIVGGAGNDRLWGGMGNDVLLGGPGDDVLLGLEGDDVLVGGAGNDYLKGHTGNNVLIGGLGNDQLFGGDGSDLLIGGYTIYDDDVDELAYVLAVWSSTDDLNERVALLNGHFEWGASVFDDGEEDTLVGIAGPDWYFSGVGDVVHSLHSDDVHTPA